MYWRARSFAGVPTARLPMVPASMLTCARAFDSEKRAGSREHADNAAESARPIVAPTAVRRAAWPTVSRMTSVGAAPSAIRTPISCVRSLTA